ncbi:chemotaxis protein CheB [Sphingobacterium corticis]|uniref:protein-glutamate methylesterase n=1 Tax=Sphingobacterium corticis TaxID=1812823 RepID=A0ABW5NIW1_9SPHI
MSEAIRNIDILLIGGSAGSLQVIFNLLPQLNENIGFPIIVVIHRKAAPGSHLEAVFKKYTNMPVYEIEDKMPLRANTVYLAPADYHVLIESRTELALDYSEKMNYSRPSIDVTFQSASEVFGSNVAALLLSGANHDGVRGLKFIKRNGGLALVQDPKTAEVNAMPTGAVDKVEIDQLLKPQDMPIYINRFAKTNNSA